MTTVEDRPRFASTRGRWYGPTVLRGVAAVLGTVLLGSCGPVSRRDFTDLDQRRIVFDDMCSLQSFFDQHPERSSVISKIVDEQSVETERTEPDEEGKLRHVMLGNGTYVIGSRAGRTELAVQLKREYDRVPELDIEGHDKEVRIRVWYWATGQMRHLRPDREIELILPTGSIMFPYNACVGQLLFDAQFYAMRRNYLDSEAARARGELPRDGVQMLQNDQSDAGGSATQTVNSIPSPDAGVSTVVEAGVVLTVPTPDAGRSR